MANSQERVKELYALLKTKALQEGALKDLNKEINSKLTEAYDSMTEEGVDSLEIEGVKFEPIIEQGFSLEGEFKGKQWDSIGAWHAWLEEIGEDALIKTKKSVHPGTRKAFLKEYLATGKPLPAFIKETFLNTIKYNKSAVERSAHA